MYDLIHLCGMIKANQIFLVIGISTLHDTFTGAEYFPRITQQ